MGCAAVRLLPQSPPTEPAVWNERQQQGPSFCWQGEHSMTMRGPTISCSALVGSFRFSQSQLLQHLARTFAHPQHSTEQACLQLPAASDAIDQGACLCLGRLWENRLPQAWLWGTSAAHRTRSAAWRLPGSHPAAQTAESHGMLSALTCSQQAALGAFQSPRLCSTKLFRCTASTDETSAQHCSLEDVCGVQLLALRGKVNTRPAEYLPTRGWHHASHGPSLGSTVCNLFMPARRARVGHLRWVTINERPSTLNPMP